MQGHPAPGSRKSSPNRLGIPWFHSRLCTNFDCNLPAGEYQHTSAVNLNSNAFAADPYHAVTAFPARNWKISWRIHYLWNAVNAPAREKGFLH